MKTKMLIVDDEQLIYKEIMYSLESEKYDIDEVTSYNECIQKIKNEAYDIIIISEFSKKKDAFQLCKEITTISSTPIIMILAKGEDINKIMALEFGADDCIIKPCNVLELKARIMAILRRIKLCKEKVHVEFNIEEFKINTIRRKLSVDKSEVNLTSKEFDLFLYLITNPNVVFSREILLKKIWGYEYYGDLRTVDVHIRRLREKIEIDSSKPKKILTKWGKGYFYNLIGG